MVDYEMMPSKMALLVFDMVNDFVRVGAPLENPEIRQSLIPKLKRLIPVCRSKGIPVIYACQSYRPDGSNWGIMAEIRPRLREKKYLMRGTDGVKVYEDIAPQPGDIVLEKFRFSAFWGTDLDVILRNLGRDTLIICGANTHLGCESTARDAQVRDYKVVFLSDGNLPAPVPDMGWGPVSKEEVQRVSLSIMADVFGRVMNIEELLTRL